MLGGLDADRGVLGDLAGVERVAGGHCAWAEGREDRALGCHRVEHFADERRRDDAGDVGGVAGGGLDSHGLATELGGDVGADAGELR